MSLPEALRLRVRGLLDQALALLVESGVKGPARVRARSKSLELTACITVPGQSDTNPASEFPGTHFSPLESAIWHALGGGPLIAKVLAKKVSQTYSPSFRTILANLVARGVLVRVKGEGYSRTRAKMGPGTAA